MQSSVEDKIIKKLEKKLNVHRKSKKKTTEFPKSFKRDGLDYLLEICDTTKTNKIKNVYGNSEGTYFNTKKIKAKKTSAQMEDIYGRDVFLKSPKSNKSSIEDNYELKILKHKLQGALNRLSQSTLEYCANILVKIYTLEKFSRYDINNSLLGILKSILFVDTKLDHAYAMELVSLIISVSQIVGIEIGAFFLENVTFLFNDVYTKWHENTQNRNKNSSNCYQNIGESDLNGINNDYKWYLTNLSTIICHFFNFKLCRSRLIYDILNMCLEMLTASDLELIIHIFQTCGHTLRKSDPQCVKLLIQSIHTQINSMGLLDQFSTRSNNLADNTAKEKVDKIGMIKTWNDVDTNIDESRIRYMLQLLLALKNNNVKKLRGSAYELIPTYLGLIRQTLKSLQGSLNSTFTTVSYNPHEFDIPYKQLVSSHISGSGKWWIVGAPVNFQQQKALIDIYQRQPLNCDNQNSDNKNEHHYFQTFLPHLSLEEIKVLDQLSIKQGLFTKDQKLLFAIITSSSHILTTHENLVKYITAGVTGKSKTMSHKTLVKIHESFNILLHCCLAEATFNNYYSLLATKMSQYGRDYKFSLEISLADKLSHLGTLKSHQMKNFSLYSYELLMTNAISLSFLRKLNFLDLDSCTTLFLRALLTHLLTTPVFHNLDALSTNRRFSENQIELQLNIRFDRVKELFRRTCINPRTRLVYESLRLFITYILEGTNNIVNKDDRHNIHPLIYEIYGPQNEQQSIENIKIMKSRWLEIEAITENV